MLRLILRLMKIQDYEVCQSCQTLREQLAYERADKQKLTETLLGIVTPKPIVVPEQPVYLEQTKPVTTFSRRRAVAEEEDRKNAQTIATSKNLGMPDEVLDKKISYAVVPKTTEELEKELGVSEKKEEKSNG